MNRKKFTQQIENQIVLDYLTGTGCYDLGRKYNCSWATIRLILIRHDIKRRSKTTYRHHYSIDENYFDIIDTEEKAYFLGFMYADGSVEKTNQITLKLQAKDVHILEKFRQQLKFNGDIKDVVCKGIVYKCLRFKSKKLANRLQELGCVINKTFKIRFPDFLENTMLQHFIRGYFDGDGSFFFKKPYKRKDTGALEKPVGFKIVGTTHFVNGCANLFKNELGINSSIERLHNNPEFESYNKIKTVNVYGALNIRKVLDCIYEDSTIYLKRKHILYIKFLERTLTNKSWKLSEDDKINITEKYIAGESMQQLRKDYNLGGNCTIKNILVNRNIKIRTFREALSIKFRDKTTESNKNE